MKRIDARSVACMAVLALAALAPAAADEIVLQIGATMPANSPWELGMKRIAAEWSTISGGQVRMVFPKSVANASQEDLLQKLKFSLDGALLDTSGLSYIDNDVFMLSLPSIIRDDAEYDAVMSVALPLIRKRFSDRYEVVALARGGWIRFFSNQPISSPVDMQRLRMAVNRNQDTLTKLFQSIGVRTIKSDSASTLLQFNSGAIDGMYSSPLYIAALWSQYRRVVTHMSGFKVAPFFGAIVLTKKAWDRIPESMRPALRAAAERIAGDIGKESTKLEEDGIAAMVRGGLKVAPYSAADASAWNSLYAEKLDSVLSSWFSADFVSTVYAARKK